MVGVLTLAALVCGPLAAVAKTVHITSPATSSVTNVDTGTCDPNTFLPMPGDGACTGSETTSDTYSGDLEGTAISRVIFVDYSDGTGSAYAYEQFTGTVVGLGSGSFTYQDVNVLVKPDGTIDFVWNVLNGSARGQLLGLKGGGKFAGSIFTGIGTYAGTLRLPDAQ